MNSLRLPDILKRSFYPSISGSTIRLAPIELKKAGLSNARQKGIAKGAEPFAGARGVLAPSTSPSCRLRQLGEVEKPVKKASFSTHESPSMLR